MQKNKISEENYEKRCRNNKKKEKCNVLRREEGLPGVYIVNQTRNRDVEFRDSYIYASSSSNDTTHIKLDEIVPEDLIFHISEQKLWAISMAESSWYLGAATTGHESEGKIGRKVDIRCFPFENPVSTKHLNDIKKKYGPGPDQPFDKNGHTKQRQYLSDLNKELAAIFINEIINANPKQKTFLEDIKKRYKLY